MDMYDFRLFVRECLKTGKADEIIKILTEENVITQGEWIKIGEIGLAYKCNKCDEVSVIPENFCPNCGASMVRGEKE